MSDAASSSEQIAAHVCVILDSLAVLATELPCEQSEPPDRLILGAKRVHDLCKAIEEAVPMLKQLLAAADASGADLLRKG